MFLNKTRKAILYTNHELFAAIVQFIIINIIHYISEPKPHFALSKWSLQEECHSTYDVSERAFTEPKMRHRGSVTTPGIKMWPFSTPC